MNLTAFLLAMVFGLMLAEARLSARNARALAARGAVLPPGDVYGIMAVLYPAAFLIMGVEGLWRAGQAGGPASDVPGPSFVLSGILLFAASKALEDWAIATLKDRWTFRVFVIPGLPLLRTGPYRYIAHPNYVGVTGELVGTAMMMRASLTGPVLVAAFGAVLIARIRFESRMHRAHGNTQGKQA